MTKKRRTDIELREYKITREKNKQLRKYAPNPFASLNVLNRNTDYLLWLSLSLSFSDKIENLSCNFCLK